MDLEIEQIIGNKEEQYEGLLPKIATLISHEQDSLANLANMIAVLHHQFNWFWTGIYIVRGDYLVLGPFQGPLACTRIHKSRGVCGSSWAQAASLVVPNVDEFPGHIACNSAARSEIVVPIVQSGNVVGVLDVDSKSLAHFDATDQKYLTQIVALINFPLPG